MNLPKPHPENSEKHLEPQAAESPPEANTGAIPAPEKSERAPLRGVIERDLVDPNQVGTGQPDPQVAQNKDTAMTNQSSNLTTINSQTVPMQGNDNNPVLADDVDVIEKEWVDKAKQIIEDTKQDPYLQEQEVEKLQQDYMRKRYGKTIKSAE